MYIHYKRSYRAVEVTFLSRKEMIHHDMSAWSVLTGTLSKQDHTLQSHLVVLFILKMMGWSCVFYKLHEETVSTVTLRVTGL